MLLKVTGAALVLVIWSGSVEVAPSWTVPKSREMGARTSGDGVAEPRRLMKSSAVLASEVISRALPRGGGVVFGNEIFGGAIPRQYVPAVEKGVRESAVRGF